ncbi:ATP-binding cassette domain-containing protein [Bacillus paranthracis]
MIFINNVSKTFSNKKSKIEAIKNINFKIYDGEVLGIIGPNGAGKSTLLRMISSIIDPTHGEIIINNISVKNNEDVKKVYRLCCC